MLQRIKSKKGFTLAELLIVVAIIAVLTAIAVPLFVTSLQKAKEAAFDANKDTVRTAAIAAILNTSEADAKKAGYSLDSLDPNYVFQAEGSFKDGKYQSVTVHYVLASGAKVETPYSSDWDEGEKTIIVKIEIKDVQKVTAVTP